MTFECSEAWPRTVVLLAGLVASACSFAPSAPMAPSSTDKLLAAESTQSGSSSTTKVLAPSAQTTATWGCMSDSAHVGCVVAGASAVPPALTTPGGPTGLTSTVNGSTVTLSWTASTSTQFDPATSYMIEAGSAPQRLDLVAFDTGSLATTFVATGVPNGTYFVIVRARNSAGTSVPSNEVAVVVAAGAPCTQPPLRPTNLTANANGSTVTVAWTAPPPPCTATSYDVRAGSQPGSSDIASFNTGSTETSLTATGVPNGSYYLRVRAVNQFGPGVFSDENLLRVGTNPAQDIVGTWTGGRTVTINGTVAGGGGFTQTYQLVGNNLTGTWTAGVNATVTGTLRAVPSPDGRTRFDITVAFQGYSLTGVLTLNSPTTMSGSLGPGTNAAGQTESMTFSGTKTSSVTPFGLWASSTGR